MGETIIDGDGAWVGIALVGATGTEQFTVEGLTVTAYRQLGIGSSAGSATLRQIEIDGSDALTDDVIFGITLQNTVSGVLAEYIFSDVYVHDINSIGQGANAFFGIGLASSASGADIDVTLDNVTVANLSTDSSSNALLVGTGIFGGGGGEASGVLRNITITNISSTTQPAAGIIAQTFGQTQNTNLNIDNATITSLDGVDPGLGFSRIGLGAITAAPQVGDSPTANVTARNIVSSASCVAEDIGLLAIGPGAGTGTPTITSTGGNLSDDNSCSSYFTQPSDQNNVAALAASLSPLADNGGFVPTMALLETSPAVDAGVAVSGLTTDARLASRPQGNAYDSGAYESPFTRTTTTPTTPPPPTDDGKGLAESGAMIVGVVGMAVVIVGGGITVLRASRITVR
jgi:hypothetical protein